MKPLKTKVSITLDSEIIDEIKILAEEDDRSFSQYINLVLKEYLKERMKNKAKQPRGIPRKYIWDIPFFILHLSHEFRLFRKFHLPYKYNVEKGWLESLM